MYVNIIQLILTIPLTIYRIEYVLLCLEAFIFGVTIENHNSVFLAGCGLAIIFSKEGSKNIIDTQYKQNSNINLPTATTSQYTKSSFAVNVPSSSSKEIEIAENHMDEISYLEVQKIKSDKLKELFAKDRDFDLSNAMASTFNSEEYKESWASARENALEGIFEKKILQQGSAIKSISCRSKHCRIELFYQTHDDVNAVSSALIKIISESNEGLFLSTFDMGFSKENKIANIYLTDDLSATLY